MPFRTFALLLLIIPPACPAANAPVPAAPAIVAKAYILLDFNSGSVIAEENADERLEPASVTKIMTAYVVFDAIHHGELAPGEMVRISKKAWRNPGVADWMKGSRMFAEVNSQVSVNDLLHGLVIQSGNDAAIALAEHLYGTEGGFVQKMNATAEKLGMRNTHFQNSTGWPAAEHYSSARDLATLARALIHDFPDMYKLFSEKQFTFNNITQANRNALLWKDDSVDGIKTGGTQSAGYCLAASAERDGMRLISVMLGAESPDARTKYSQQILNYGFRFYETYHLFDGGHALRDARVWKGDADNLQLGIRDDLYVTIPRGDYGNLKSIMNVRKSIFAPINTGEVMGYLDVYLGEKLLRRQDLIALQTVARGNFLQRLVDQIAYLLQ